MSLQRYNNYRDSGVEWLGEVPSHWDICQSRRMFAVRSEPARPDDRMLTASQKYGVLYQDDFVEREGRRVVEVILGLENLKHVEPNDFIISMRSFQGGIEWCQLRGSTSFHYVMIRPLKHVYPPFFSYLLKSPTYIQALRSTSDLIRDGQELRYSNFVQVPLPVVPIEEQRAIADYLGRETEKIDVLMEEQRRLIELLKEKREAVTSLAVTKGVDPSAPMRDSGIEQLGEVPAHWEIGTVKRFFKFLDGRRVPLSSEERAERLGVFPYYGASGIIDYIDDFIFDEDLVLVSEDGANLLNRATPISFVATGQYWVNNHAHILRPPDENLMYWSERLEALDLARYVTGSAQPKLTIDALANIPIAVPPDSKERAEISSRIAKLRSEIDPLVMEADAAISLLHERRAALIYSAVTGKIDVRSTTANKPNVNPEDVRDAVGAEVIRLIWRQPTFGRVKFQKLVYLAEAHVGIPEIGGRYDREAAGPYDRILILELEANLRANGLADIQQPGGAGAEVSYRFTGNEKVVAETAKHALGSRLAPLHDLIKLLGDIKTDSVEAVATLYAVWNDMLLDDRTPDDKDLINGVLEDWHPEKGNKFKPADLARWLDWMRRHEFTPKGQGPRTTRTHLLV